MLGEVVFVGGCTTTVFITDKAAAEVRPTYDVDAIAEISSYAAYADFSQRLRKCGFTEDTGEGALICRWHQKKTMMLVVAMIAVAGLLVAAQPPTSKMTSIDQGATVNIQATYWISRTTQAEEAAKCLLYGRDRFSTFARTSAKSKYSQISKSTGEDARVPALVFQLVPLACFYGFGRIYRCIPDLLVNDQP